MKAKVYRSGTVEAPAAHGVEAESYTLADAVKPEGRQGRTGGIFASPNLRGVARWAYSKSCPVRYDQDPFVREITVDPETVYVYSISTWEKGSWRTGDYTEYWATGMTLAEWLKNEENYDPTDWELLLSPEDIQAVKPVSDKRLLKACETSFNLHGELVNTLASARRALRWA